MPPFAFVVYVAGRTVLARRAVANLRALCLASVGPEHDIQVVDVLDTPALAEEARILATPTVIRLTPPPSRRVIGDLSNLVAAATALDLPHPDRADSEDLER